VLAWILNLGFAASGAAVVEEPEATEQGGYGGGGSETVPSRALVTKPRPKRKKLPTVYEASIRLAMPLPAMRLRAVVEAPPVEYQPTPAKPRKRAKRAVETTEAATPVKPKVIRHPLVRCMIVVPVGLDVQATMVCDVTHNDDDVVVAIITALLSRN
jgi:hypothetical protein